MVVISREENERGGKKEKDGGAERNRKSGTGRERVRKKIVREE